MLPIYALCNTRRLQKAIAVANHGAINKQATLHQAAATYAGFDNMAQALALTDRHILNEQSVWCEFSEFYRAWVVYANGHEFVVSYTLLDQILPTWEINPHVEAHARELNRACITAQNITYSHRERSLTLHYRDSFRLTFVRREHATLSCALTYDDGVIFNGACEVGEPENVVFWDAGSQLPRLLDEMIAVGPTLDMDALSASLGLPEATIRDTLATATWLFEKGKGNDDEAILADLKPARTQTAPIGAVAWAIWTTSLRDAPREVDMMLDSMSLDEEGLDFLLRMAWADAQRYHFTAFNR